jgi:polyhydroxybutyrate depolymerase
VPAPAQADRGALSARRVLGLRRRRHLRRARLERSRLRPLAAGVVSLPARRCRCSSSSTAAAATRTTCGASRVRAATSRARAASTASRSPRAWRSSFPNGSDAPAARLLSRGGLRTWNAGGGRDGTVCVSGDACKRGVDDVAYVRALLADVGRRIEVDPKRVFATGFSNGAALAHRLACDAADLFAAVAPVSGENQAALAACRPSRPVALLVVHGTLDRCWPYAAAPARASPPAATSRSPRPLAGWAARNGCRAEPVRTTLAARRGVPADGTQVVRHAYVGCAPAARSSTSRSSATATSGPTAMPTHVPKLLGGTMSRQLDASRAVVDFLVAHGRL